MSRIKSGMFIAGSELLLLLTGCSPMEAACTEIGAPPGVAVIVEKTIAAMSTMFG